MVNIASNQQLIYEALAQLPADYRAVVRRSYYGAQSTAQIAEDLHITEDTVKSRLHYAVQALLLALREKGVTR
jgi:RNA polymerase sigma-70 factor, ECF subfamily